jgi:methionyl-tRNA formyltransferase
MQMDAGLDTGPMLSQQAIAIEARETAGTLHDRLAALGARMIIETLRVLEHDGALRAIPQPEGATYATKIGRADTLIDWSSPPALLDRRIRALSPMPGAIARWRGAPVKIRSALPLTALSTGDAGMVVAVGASGIDVVCGGGPGRGTLRLLELQPAGGRTMPAHAFAAGRGVVPGSRFEAGA